MVATAQCSTDTGQTNLYGRIQTALAIEAIDSEKDLLRLVEDRLSIQVIGALVKHGLTDNEVYALIIPRRTLAHRKLKREPLSQEESERAVRVARITALAEAVFGDPAQALRWLRKPKRRFERRTPLELLATETGARLVEEMLYQIDEGLFA
jgi:putative toxin-antitoxin system antitoxin component (TIGR02293 family)